MKYKSGSNFTRFPGNCSLFAIKLQYYYCWGCGHFMWFSNQQIAILSTIFHWNLSLRIPSIKENTIFFSVLLPYLWTAEFLRCKLFHATSDRQCLYFEWDERKTKFILCDHKIRYSYSFVCIHRLMNQNEFDFIKGMSFYCIAWAGRLFIYWK